mmetsp:Transcript_16703/g.24202  ORF Transcript_16703/g.24202 Transcript_16703/m.24202 type:complete len:386 (-) Transcript_16703:810-1967(-)
MVGLDSASKEDHDDVALAHEYRLSLTTKPRQSSFRVVALVFLKPESIDINKATIPGIVCWEGDRPYLVGSNSESCWMGNSICAERAALVQLRWFPDTIVSKIVVVTDAPCQVSPGMLCREFMASMDQIPWDTPVLLAGTNCQLCGKCPLETDQACSHSRGACQRLDHITNIRELYPHPSLYVRTAPSGCVEFGSKWKDVLLDSESELLKVARSAIDLTDPCSDLHPITYAAAVYFRDKSFAKAVSKKALEYGCSLDAVTQLSPILEAKRNRGIEPLELVQIDHFGIAHAPFGAARAFLVEHGYGNLKVFVHSYNTELRSIEWKTMKAVDLAPNIPSHVRKIINPSLDDNKEKEGEGDQSSEYEDETDYSSDEEQYSSTSYGSSKN